MKTLYISDLDGTLLNENAELSSFAVENLNRLIESGINFTIATGRGGSALGIMKPINLRMPIVMLNGALCYDALKSEVVLKEVFSAEKVNEVLVKIAGNWLEIAWFRTLGKTSQ